ncbi:MAG TPA: response regulator [Thermoanaerobaculia bacterium]
MTVADILIVDDNPSNLTLLAGILRARGHKVRWATSGRRALSAVKAEAPDLLMLDISMPEMDGYEVCVELKSNSATRHIPVIFISALDDALDKVRAFQVGGVDYVTKPFQAEEVVARVDNQLRIWSLQRELERQNTELTRKNRELLDARTESRMTFSALAEALTGGVIADKYRVEEMIGAGGFGAVYRATDLLLEREVAVKVLRPLAGDEAAAGIKRFRREGISTCRVQHPNAVTVFDFGVSKEGIQYLAMELLKGRSVEAELKEEGVLSVARCARVVVPVCRVLAAAHAAGVVHRDVKPANIFLHESAEGEVVKVLDFGIATLCDTVWPAERETITKAGQVVGSVLYMAPERLYGLPCDGRADVYSLGVLVQQLLTGQLPFTAPPESPEQLIVMHMTMAPVPLRTLDPTIPAAVEELVLAALEKSPERRPTAAEFGERLEAAVGTPYEAVGPAAFVRPAAGVASHNFAN